MNGQRAAGKAPPDSAPCPVSVDTEVRRLMRACDWAASPLGSPETWPTSLRSIVQVMLTSRFAMWMAWGPELTFLCNDAYLPTVGLKKDWVIGSRSDQVWAEIWPDIGPRIDHVLRTGEATWDEALQLYLERAGFSEETYHTFSYSPLTDDDDKTAGMLCVVAEVTQRVIGERQLATLRDLGSCLAAAATRGEVMAAIEQCLGPQPHDLPFLGAYLVERDGEAAVLGALHGLERGASSMPERIALGGADPVWPLAEARSAQGGLLVDAPLSLASDLTLSFWQMAPHNALIMPIVSADGGQVTGYLVAGLNPHRSFDDDYRGFIQLLTAQIAAAIARADDYERERQRAEALAELDRAKTTFFSNISHEFRTPLTLMLGPLEEVQSSLLTAQQRASIDAAHRNAMRLLRLVNALLDFSRIEAGRVEATYRPTDLPALTADLASSFRAATDRAGLGFVVDTPPLSQPVHVDRDMWEKIVLNLVSNAFKFTHEGEIALSLREEADAVVLAVRDTGVGIPQAEVPRLFDRFHRVEQTRGRSFEGSGIGLALVQELVKLHGGSISVESIEGQGTCFTVRIPLGTQHLPAERIASGEARPLPVTRSGAFVEEAMRWLPQPVSENLTSSGSLLETTAQPDAAGNSGAGERILIADDNADLRAYLTRLLGQRGYRVDVACDGEAALRAMRRRRPDLLVTDIMMPVLDGFGLLHAVRADPELQGLPVIMLSARAGEEAQVEGLDAGADDYLTKPFSARELLARVAANLAMARMRREAMATLAESEARFRNMADHAPVMLWVTDAAGACAYLNKAWYAFTGQTPEQAEWFGWLQATHPDDRGRTANLFLDANDRAKPFQIEYRLRRTDGEWRWVVDAAAPRFGSDGAFLGFIGSVVDIDDRKRAEEVLERRVAEALAEKRLLADIVEATDASVQVIDPGFRLLALNTAAMRDCEALYDLRPSVGQSLQEALAHCPEQRDAAQRLWQRALDGETFTETAWWGGGKTERRAYETRFSPLKDATGQCIGAFVIGQDVTDRLREQERLRAAEEQLRQAQKMEAMGQLTGGVAHDFNNLLTPIVGALDMMQRRGFGGEREQRWIAGAAQAAERARVLVQRLLAFARRQPLQATAVDITGLVRGMTELISSTTGPRIRMVLAVAESMPPAKADPNQLEMALLNLAVNARDAMPEGGTLTIGAEVEQITPPHRSGLAAGGYIRLAVIDTGIGMDEAVLARAVEPFFSTKGIGKGTGLGLSMVHGLAAQLGGALTIGSRPGKGTTIELWLPISEAAMPAETPAHPPPESSGGLGTVLLVDDEELVRASTADMLADLGYAVIEVGSAEEALAFLRDGLEPTILMTDHLMPGMTGTDLARLIRAERPGLDVLLISGYADAAGVAPDLPRLVKPFRNDELAASLAGLDARSPGAPNERPS